MGVKKNIEILAKSSSSDTPKLLDVTLKKIKYRFFALALLEIIENYVNM